MLKTIFYGCGAESVARYVCSQIQIVPQSINQSINQSIDFLLAEIGGIAYCDQNSELWGTTYFGLPVISPTEVQKTDYDRIVITACSTDAILFDLTQKYEVNEDKIISEPASQLNRSRNHFVHTFASLAKKRGLRGNVAEGGVYQGNYAKEINAAFPDSTLYLFDTFEGFVKTETHNDEAYVKTGRTHSHFRNTSVQTVMNNLPYPNNAIIRKGFFPESATDVDGDFVFVNLDFDLYAPILAGLEFFYPKLVIGGVILIHDYFASEVFAANKAVDEFCLAHNLYPLPIGDVLSVAIIKQQ